MQSDPARAARLYPPRSLAACSALVTAVVPSLACQDYLFDQVCPESVTEARVTAAVARPAPVDILFVIDNSGSMRDEQENLVRNFGAFIDVLAGSTLDYRLGVVTTDQSVDDGDVEEAGFVTVQVDEASPYKTVEPTRSGDSCTTLPGVRHGCFRSGRALRWIDGQVDDRAAAVAAFADAARVGTCGSGAEQGTNALRRALEFTAPGECNAGFLRAEANLVVVIVTDEDDFDPRRPEEILAALSASKPIERMRLALIASFVDGAPSRCRTGPDGRASSTCGDLCQMPAPPPSPMGRCANTNECPVFFECVGRQCVTTASQVWDADLSGYGCDSCSAFAVPSCCAADVGAERYFAFARAFEAAVAARDPRFAVTGCTGGGTGRTSCLVDSICQAEFAGTLQRIARDLVVTTQFPLSPPASYPPGVVVRIVGGRYASAPRVLVQGTDYTISADGALLDLTSADALPREDEELDVFFTVESTIDAPRVGACAAGADAG